MAPKHDDIDLFQIVIPGMTKPTPCLTRGNPLPTGRQEYFSRFLLEFIPMEIGAGMTFSVGINDVVYNSIFEKEVIHSL